MLMIQQSFIFLEKVGRKKEQKIFQQAKNWQQFLNKDKIKGIATKKKFQYDRQIQEAQKSLKEEKPEYFVNRLPKKEMWRLYNYFKEDCCFLDIEVDSKGQIIIVGISNDYSTKTFVAGINLDKNSIQKELQKYKIIITFNGGAFDLPKLRKQLQLRLTQPHIDLKPLCVNLGLKGGLKEIERILQLKRPQNLQGSPVSLWKAFHASGDKEYLDLLIQYNNEDCENLRAIINKVYGELSKFYQ